MRSLLVITAFCLIAGFFSPPSSQAITLGFGPASQYRHLGESFNVDIVISDLGSEIVSMFDLLVAYDSTILDSIPPHGTFGSFLNNGDPLLSFQGIELSSPGVIRVIELSIITDEDFLAGFQQDSFVLASLSYNAIAEGASGLAFLPDPLFGIDVKGRDAQILALDHSNGNVTVGPAVISAIPEPGTITLLSSGLAALAFRRFRR